ncbi:SagB/ThcOx family dehydrogenase [Streptomyces virginiae]
MPTRAYHFSSRVTEETPIISADDDDEHLAAKHLVYPAPRSFLQNPGCRQIRLPDVSVDGWRHRDLIDVLERRRSRRSFGTSPVSLADVGALLHLAASPQPAADGEIAHLPGSVFRTSPSGGARHPIELYIYAKNIEGLEPGVYHYSPLAHCLEDLKRPTSTEQAISACLDQEWTGGASFIIFYTGVIERSQWKYPDSRAYRVLWMDLGHLSQTVYLLATSRGLNITFTGALKDESVESILGCDGNNEVILGASVVGSPQGEQYPA